jgi:hypothetical protein
LTDEADPIRPGRLYWTTLTDQAFAVAAAAAAAAAAAFLSGKLRATAAVAVTVSLQEYCSSGA